MTKPICLLPQSDHAKRLATIFKRRLSTAWNEKKEIKPFRAMHKLITEEDLALVERMYRVCWPPIYGHNALRHHLAQLINNWQGEVDKARIWAERHPLKTAVPVRKIIPLPPQNDEPLPTEAEMAESRAQFKRMTGRDASW